MAQISATAEDGDVVSGGKVSVELADRFNTAYMGTIYVGSPPQQIRALFDTGSANTWVFSQKAKDDLSAED